MGIFSRTRDKRYIVLAHDRYVTERPAFSVTLEASDFEDARAQVEGSADGFFGTRYRVDRITFVGRAPAR